MTQEHHDEVDLVYVIKKIKEIIKGWIVLLFKALGFMLKYWWVILLLIIIGFGLGWYKVKDQVPSRKSTVIARINYDLQPYVQNAIELHNSKQRAYDSIFLSKNGFSPWNPEVKEVLIEPIIDFKDVLDDYQINERSLDMLLNRMEFTEEMPLSDVLVNEYDYFKFDISLSGYAKPEDVQKLFDYLNNDPRLVEYKTAAAKNMSDQIAHNNKSLALIDGVFESYLNTENGGTDVGPRDKGFDLNELMDAKLIVQDRNQVLKNEFNLATDIVVPMHELRTRDAEGRLLNKKHIIYPIFFVFIFLFLAYARYVFLYLRGVARENNN